MAFDTGPYLLAAFLCETILVEQDGVKSAIRIFDRTTQTVSGTNPPQQMEPFDYEMTLFLAFKSGSARGPMTVLVTIIRPDGESPTPFQHQLYFEGEDDRGVELVAKMRVHVPMPGVYWFLVALDGTPVTRIPWRVIYEPKIVRQTRG